MTHNDFFPSQEPEKTQTTLDESGHNANDQHEQDSNQSPAATSAAKEEFKAAGRTQYLDHKFLQIAAGIVLAGVVWALLWFGSEFENEFLRSAWIILFGIIFLGKRWYENKHNIFFRYFSYTWLFSLIAALVLTVAYMLIFRSDINFIDPQ